MLNILNRWICSYLTFIGGMLWLDLGGDSPPAPDYTPMANASKESSEIMAAQADRVLDESKRQYDLNMAVTKPVVDAQIGIMEETARQGKDYYDYMVDQQRPVERALNEEAMAAGSEAMQNDAVGKAVADSQGGYTRAINQGIRQARRYGVAPIAATGTMAIQQAQNTAAAATGAREREKNLGYAKKMDVAGLYRGLSGASQGAYGVATNAGNSAVGNQMTPGNALTNGMVASAGITGQGRQLLQSGLGAVLGAQQNAYSTALQADSNGFGGLLSGLGGIGQGLGAMKTAGFFAGSDRRTKENVVEVGKDESTGLKLYEFNYLGDPDHRFRGVMADEVEQVAPDAVVYDDLGFASVNYGKLGIKMEEV